MSYAQPFTWTRDSITGGLFSTCRGRDKIGPQPTFKKIVFSGFEAFADSRAPAGGGGGGGTTNRDQLVYGEYKPTKDLVGHITPRANLVDFNSPTQPGNTTVVLSTPGMTVSGKIMYGIIQRGANNITITDCLCLGPSTGPTTETAVIRLYDNSFIGTIIKDVTIAPRFPNQNQDAIKGNNYQALRVHAVFCVDGFGIFTNAGSVPTNTRVMGCLSEAHVYCHGQGYASGGGTYWNGTSYTSFVAGTSLTRANDGFIDAGHNDGNHSDGVQIQGAFGSMTRVGNTDSVWSGDGVWVHGNNLNTYDAVFNMTDPTNSLLIIPGQAGSLTNSRLGTQDSPKRKDQLPSDTAPITGGSHFDDGHWTNNGAGIAITPVVNEFPFQGPTQWSVVVTKNWIDNTNIALNMQKSGKATSGIAFLDNRLGPHVYTFSNGSNYLLRIYTGGVTGNVPTTAAKATIRFAKRWNDTTSTDTHAGLFANFYDDPTNRWGIDGDPITLAFGSPLRGGVVYSN